MNNIIWGNDIIKSGQIWFNYVFGNYSGCLKCVEISKLETALKSSSRNGNKKKNVPIYMLE